MTSCLPPHATDFLASDPVPVTQGVADVAPSAADQLPPDVVDELMRTSGVDGVWIEHSASGERIVVLHYSFKGTHTHLPSRVEGMPTRIVGGEPIRAQQPTKK